MRARAALALSEDHKPNRTDERSRIEAAGGVVVWAGTWRVGGVLAVSRAFGDRLLKRCGSRAECALRVLLPLAPGGVLAVLRAFMAAVCSSGALRGNQRTPRALSRLLLVRTGAGALHPEASKTRILQARGRQVYGGQAGRACGGAGRTKP